MSLFKWNFNDSSLKGLTKVLGIIKITDLQPSLFSQNPQIKTGTSAAFCSFMTYEEEKFFLKLRESS